MHTHTFIYTYNYFDQIIYIYPICLCITRTIYVLYDVCVCVFMIVCISFHGIQLQFPFLPMDPGQPPCSGKPRVQPTFTWSDLCVCRWGMIR